MSHKKNTIINILFQSDVSGDNYYAQNLNAKEIISRMNPEKFFITTFFSGQPDDRLKNKKNIHLIHLPSNKFLKHIYVFFEMFKSKYDIIFYVRNLEGYFYLKLRKLERKRKIAVHCIENVLVPDLKNYQKNEMKFIAQNADFTSSISQYVSDEIKEKFDITTEIMPIGVDYNYFFPDNGIKSPDITALFVGSLQKRKRPDFIIDLAQKFPSIKFVLVGDGPLKIELFLKIESGDLRNITILNELKKNELIKLYQSSHIFVFPSYYEGLPKVTLEAAACGLPIIAFNRYQPESIINNVTGFVVDSDEEFIQKLQLLCNNSELREEMGLKGREFVKKFNWDSIVKRWEQVFEQSL